MRSIELDEARALELLAAGCGRRDARFRAGQLEAIRHVVLGRGRMLVVQRTGWGKSFVYFIACELLREAGLGPSLLISPLLSLMRNQIDAARRMGLRAETIHSDNVEQWRAIERKARADELDVLLISPERLANGRFQEEVLAPLGDRIAFVIVDEAHCISDWGHDFRPHYRLVERTLRALPANVRLLATTATANQRVIDDLRAVLGNALAISRGDLARASLDLQTIRLRSQAARLAWLAEQLPRMPGTGIVYALTVRDAELVARWLRSRGLAVEAYTSEGKERREPLEQALLRNEVKALVATTALGMGFDKPDVGFVVHFQAPGSVIAYYQQVGRAGRELDAAYGVLLSGEEETDITDWFIASAFPSRAEVEALLAALDAAPVGLSIGEIEARVNARRGRLMKALDLLSLESPAPLVKEGSCWRRTVAPLAASFWERTERLTALRKAEQQQMQEYARLGSGHMEFLLRALDGEAIVPRERRLPLLPTHVDPALAEEAARFLDRVDVPIEPRARWPVGGLLVARASQTIALDRRAEPGRALCMYGDAGLGDRVRAGKYKRGEFDEALVEACSRLLDRWRPQPRPEWVTCIPSLRRPDLVPSLARRLAAMRSLPFHPLLVQTRERPEQKSMQNSANQARNLDGTLAIAPGVAVPAGAVLLVDDLVDSGWSFTFAAHLLREHGSGPVHPLALARSTGADGDGAAG